MMRMMFTGMTDHSDLSAESQTIFFQYIGIFSDRYDLIFCRRCMDQGDPCINQRFQIIHRIKLVCQSFRLIFETIEIKQFFPAFLFADPDPFASWPTLEVTNRIVCTEMLTNLVMVFCQLRVDKY